MNYKKSQTGWIMFVIFIPILILLNVLYTNQLGNNPLPLIPYIIISVVLIFAFALFYRLTVEVDSTFIRLSYGIGLIRIKFSIDELLSSEVIKTPWYYGLGIRITPKGMLYNIQGSGAVKIEFTSKGKHKTIMIGSGEPDKLKLALEGNFKKRGMR